MGLHLSVRICSVDRMNTTEAGALVAQKIKVSGVSVLKVSEDTGIPRTTLIRKLKGVAQFGTTELVQIANSIGVKPSELLPSEFKEAS